MSRLFEWTKAVSYTHLDVYKRQLVLCMLAAAIDGYDTQAIGYTAPAIAQAFNLPREVFGPVFSAGLVGAAVGALSFGPLADRFGRKRFMVAAVIIFGVFSLLTAQATTLSEFLAFRFCAGLGLGGAVPSFLALGGEFAPASKRGVFVAIAFAAFPFGGLIGALTSSYVIPHFGWQSVFYIGGAAPLLFAIVLVIWLPESLRFLIARNIRLDEVRSTLMRLSLIHICWGFLRANTRDSPLRFGISFSGVGGPLNAPRSVASNRRWSSGMAIRYAPVNRCIYCGTIEGPLSEEHIVPFALGGEHILQAASCRACAKITAALEQSICRAMLGNFRVRMRLPTRRKKERPTTLPVMNIQHPTVVAAAEAALRAGRREFSAKIEPLQVQPHEYPTSLLMCLFNSPGVLLGKPRSDDVYPMEMSFWKCGNHAEMANLQLSLIHI